MNSSNLLLNVSASQNRSLTTVKINSDFTVVGGGLAGVCAAITAARQGILVTLVQDRPVLGGNASSEVRIWALGATSHMGNNNRWSREGGVIDEILVENMYRNKEGNPVIFDAVILDKVLAEKNITLLLNTSVYDVVAENHLISMVKAFNSQNSTTYEIRSKQYCDASGDGIVAFLSGAAFRYGAEDRSEFDECFSPSENYGRLLGHTITLYSKKEDHPVDFVAPDFALKDITALPKFKEITPDRYGCNYWWFEYGGNLDTIHDSETIKEELWSVVYGAWNYIKNSGKFPEAANLTLEWVGMIPGKRESRRFEGYYMLNQKDIIQQRHFDDAVAFGGWAIDLHPAQGVYSPLPSCNQYHSKGIYSIPYRCYISKDVENLFYAGRIISVSHVAYGSTRVMATCAHGGQAVGMAAALCVQKSILPSDVMERRYMQELQQRLNVAGQSIRQVPIDEKESLLSSAKIQASSVLQLDELPSDQEMYRLDFSAAQLLPLRKGVNYDFTLEVNANEATDLEVQLCTSSKNPNYTPDVLLQSATYPLHEGRQEITLSMDRTLDEEQYVFLICRANPKVSVRLSPFRCTGLVSVFNKFNLKVNNHGKQMPPEDSGFESFEFWCPDRRPAGKNLHVGISPALTGFGTDHLVNGFIRPTSAPNAWIAAIDDEHPVLNMTWEDTVAISELTFYFDTDYDHAMESVQYGHPEQVIPFCVSDFRICGKDGEVLAEVKKNHSTICKVKLAESYHSDEISVVFDKKEKSIPVSVFEIRIK